MSQSNRDIHSEISALTETFFRQLMREFCATDCHETVAIARRALQRCLKTYKP
jgi:hypothetical protein